jgi:DNA polymerase-3 subunit epsilon
MNRPLDDYQNLSLLAEILALDKPLVCIDLETTGTFKDIDKIVQIGVVKIYPDGKVNEWQTLVNPLMPIPPEATAVHGITDEMVKDAPTFPLVSRAIAGGLEGTYVVAFNGNRLDMPFLQQEMKKAGVPWTAPDIIDPYKINMRFNPRSLSDLYREIFGREMGGAHDALADVKGTLEIFAWMLERYDTMPRTPAGVIEMFTEVKPGTLDCEGKFAWRNGVAVVNFGNKWAGTPLTTARTNPKFREYLGWMIRSDFRPDAKKICRDALSGIFPVKPGDTMEEKNGEENVERRGPEGESSAEGSVDVAGTSPAAGDADLGRSVQGGVGRQTADPSGVGQPGFFDRDEGGAPVDP